MKKVLILLGLLISGSVLFTNFVFAENCDSNCNSESECSAKIVECKNRLDMLIAATKPHEQSAQVLEKEMASIESNIKSLGALIDKKKAAIEVDSKKFEASEASLNSQVRDFYKKNWTSSFEYFLATVLTQDSIGDTLHNLAYRQNLIDREKKTITSLVLDISDLQKQKTQLENDQSWLAAKQESLAVTLAPIRKVVTEAKAYQS
jgi:peptidoglycan hydrolase CwlO-like protein